MADIIPFNKPLSAKQVREHLNISTSYWDRHKNEILEYLDLFFDYDIDAAQGTRPKYIFYRQIAEYEPFKRTSRAVKLLREEYIPQILGILSNNPGYYTFKMIAEKINVNADHALSTKIKYCSKAVKEMCGNAVREGGTHGYIDSIDWCKKDKRLNQWIPLDEDELQDFFTSLDRFKVECTDEIIKTCGEYVECYITSKEFETKIVYLVQDNYKSALLQFQDKHGFIPHLIKHYIIHNNDIH